MNNKPNILAWSLLLLSTGLMIYLFAASRNDPSLRIAALVAGTALVSSLGSIASTMLTGKDVTSRELPPGASLSSTQQSTLQVPPDPKA